MQKSEIIPALLQVCPSVGSAWEEHIVWWGDDERGDYNDIAVFAHHIVESYSVGEYAEFPAFFRQVENRPVNKAERHLLTNYQHLLRPPERMIARCLVASSFDLDQLPRSVMIRVQSDPRLEVPRWQLPIVICMRLLREHRTEIHLLEDLKGAGNHDRESARQAVAPDRASRRR